MKLDTINSSLLNLSLTLWICFLCSSLSSASASNGRVSGYNSHQEEDEEISFKRSISNNLISFILEPPSRIDFYNTTGALIPCAAIGDPKPTVWWISLPHGYKVTEVPGLRHLRSDGSLVFPPFKASDYRDDIHSSVYRCVAGNSYGIIGSKDVHVTGVVKQNYNIQVFDEFSIQENTAVLRCNLPTVAKEYITVTSWIRDESITIVSSAFTGGRYSVFPDGHMHIRRASFEDGLGSYRCVTRNKLTGEISASITAGKLVVTESHNDVPPRIIHSLSRIDAETGQNIELACAAQGYPSPTYTWYRVVGVGSSLLPVTTDTPRISQVDGSLLIKDIGLDDGGKYLCLVNNTSGREKAEMDLIVRVPLHISVHPRIVRVEIGGSALFICNVTGYPIDRIRWSKDQNTIVPNNRYRIPVPETLQIQNVKREDKGLYQCYAYSDSESAQSVAQLKLGEEAPVIKDAFKSRNVKPETFVTLKCVATGNPLPQITWSIDDELIPESKESLSIGDFVTANSEVVSYVNISQIKVEEGGLYGCHANNDVKRVSHYARINVFGPPIVKPMKDLTAVEGDPLIIHCSSAGYPIEEIYWEHNNRRIPYNHRQRIFPNGSLLIDFVDKRNDVGEYKCVVRSNQGPSGSDIRVAGTRRVKVLSPPVIDPFSFPKFLEEGSRSKVLCTVMKGDPPFSIKWFKAGKPIMNQGAGTDLSVVALDDYSVALVFSRVSLSSRGNYTCIASNIVASTNYSATAVVHARPRWVIEPMNTVGVTGKDVFLHCQADGFPEPVVDWKRADGDSLSSPYRTILFDGRLLKMENNSLQIKSVDKSDGGFYMCQADNGIGSGISTVIELQVRSPAYFKEEFKVETVKRGNVLVIKCQAYGDKPLKLKWRKDGQAFSATSDKRYAILETITEEGIISELRVENADRRDSSLFTCNASNTYGSDQTNIQVIVQERPDSPSKAGISKVESRSITINWSPPYAGNSPILHYVIEYKEVTDEWSTGSKQQRVPGTETKATISSLWPGTAYHLRLMAENGLGKSDAGIVLHAITELEVPAESPTEVKAEAFGSKSIKVKWKSPKSMRLRNHIKGYYIGYKPSSAQTLFTYKTVEVMNQNGPYEAVVNNLQPLTKYVIIVKAFNRKGSGPPSSEIFVKTNDIDVPNAPRIELLPSGQRSVAIKWEINEDNNANGLQGFTIYLKEDLGAWQEYGVSSDLRSYIFKDLYCGTRYQVYITARNEAGNGIPSQTLSTKTPGTVPIAPSQAMFLRTNGTSTTLHLTEWQDGGCPLKEFKIQYRHDKSRDWKIENPISGDTVSYSIVKLTPNTWYRLRVAAINEAGTTEAEYTFSTAGKDGKMSPQPGWSITEDRIAWINMMLFPFVLTTVIMTCILVIFCGVKKKPPNAPPDRAASMKESITYAEQVQMSEVSLKQSRTNLYDKTTGPKECLYYPSGVDNQPNSNAGNIVYSENDVAAAASETFANLNCRQMGDERTYDVPFLVTKPKSSLSPKRYSMQLSDIGYSSPSQAQQQVKDLNDVIVKRWPKYESDYQSFRYTSPRMPSSGYSSIEQQQHWET